MNTDQNKFIYQHLNRINWVFFDLSHPGNLGASARALKVMGASNLNLVNPVHKNLASNIIAIRRAAGATDVLKASTEMTFEEATEDSNYVIAFSSREREIQPPSIEFYTMIDKVVELLKSSNRTRVSMVFGGERTGLRNEDLIKCSHVCKFDVSPVYSSLNLSHAVQVVSHALRSKLKTSCFPLTKNNYLHQDENKSKVFITQKKISDLKESFIDVSTQVGLIKPRIKGRIEEKISRILVTSKLTMSDFKLLRSFFALIKKKLKDKP